MQQSELKGSINLMAIADILQWINQGGKTGLLRMQGRRFQKTIYFREGNIIATGSTNPKEYLGQFLISYGKITEEGLKSVLEAQEKSDLMLGKILVDEGILTLTEMKMFLKLKAEESLYDIFLWDEGDFEFMEDLQIEKELIEINLNVTSVILEGVRRVDEWKRIREIIPDGTYVPVIKTDMVIEALPLSTNLTKLLRAVNGRKSVDDISMEFRSSNFIVFKNLFECYQNGYIRLKQPRKIIQETMEEDVNRKIDALMQQSLMEAWTLGQTFLEKYPESEMVQKKMAGIRQKADDVTRRGIGIPVLDVPLSDLTNTDLSPEEGFLVSRINAKWDINAIIKISPIPEDRARIIFADLLVKGVLTFDDASNASG